ncbi:MAG: methionine aminopeptidase [Candidatus Westeberhardia cardiocondylae]|nr:methionine aminopeptidase [Candidatus Westeberhardia cardiocondylae]
MFNFLDKMRFVCRLASEVLEYVEFYVKPGVSTGELDSLCHNYIVNNQNAIPASLGYHGFPKSVCISVNEVVCHGIPSNKKRLKNGDIVNIDVAIIKDGCYGDTSKMFFVGSPSILSKRLCKVSQNSLYLAIYMVRPGLHIKELGKSIQKFVELENFSVVREYCGHGIGKNFHEDPHVLHYESDDFDCILNEGMIFTIEPMVNVGTCFVRVMKDGWTVKTKDHGFSAQYEHTVLVTKYGCEIMTLRSDEKISKIINHF